MNKAPLVSIVIPTYNRAHAIKRAIISVENQTYPNFELIVVNDPNSTDNTEEVVSGFNDERIKYLRAGKTGVSASRNRGIELAEGNYLIFLDSDDELLPHALEEIVNEFETLPCDIMVLFYNCIDYREKNLTATLPFDKGPIKYEDVICERYHGEVLSVIRKEVFQQFRFIESVRGVESTFWYKILKTHKAYAVNTPLRIYHTEGKNRLSEKTDKDTILNLTEGRVMLLQIIGDDLRNACPKKYGQYLLSVGFGFVLGGKRNEGLRYLLRSIEYRSGLARLKASILIIASIFFSSDLLRSLFSILTRLRALRTERKRQLEYHESRDKQPFNIDMNAKAN